MKYIERVVKFLESPGVGRHSGKIFLGSLTFVVAAFVCYAKFGLVSADAVCMDTGTCETTNEVRMVSIEYVFEFDDTVDSNIIQAYTDYCYWTIDSVQLLHMVNMRQHVIFTKKYSEITLVGDILYVPVNANAEDMWEAIKNMP